MAKGVSISVVIPTYNRRELLEKNLHAISRQTLPADRIEVVVVNDGGTDDTEDMLDAFDPPFRSKYVRQENRVDVPYNVGGRMAENDFVLFLDDDVIPHPRMLEAHIASHNRFDGPTIVLGQLQWPEEKVLTPFQRYASGSGMLMGTHLIEDPDSVHFKFVAGGNLSVPRPLFQESGGYDTAFNDEVEVYGHIDTEFGYRLITQFDARLVYNPGASADHWCCAPFPLFLEQRRRAGRTAVIFYEKHAELARHLKIEWVKRRGPYAWLVRNCLHAAYHLLRPLVPALERFYPFSRPLLFPAYRVCIFYHFQKGIRDVLIERGYMKD